MNRMLHVCAEPDCPELVGAGETYCPEHAVEAQAVRAQKDRKIKARSVWRWVYKDPRWQGLRRQVRLEQPFCAVVECNELTADVDHIKPLRDGGPPFRSGESAWSLQASPLDGYNGGHEESAQRLDVDACA